MRGRPTETRKCSGCRCAQATAVGPAAEPERAHGALKDKVQRTNHRKAFEAAFADWIAEQNDCLRAHGVPGAELRPW
jgi:hypothetical protein